MMQKQTRKYYSTLTSKGQVTVPAPVHRALGLPPQDKVVFHIVEGQVLVESLPMTLEEAFGSVPPLHEPEDFQAIRAIAREERAERVSKKGLTS